MVLKPCARPPKQPILLLYMVQEEGLAHGFKTINNVHGFKTMCIKTMCKPCARGFKTMHMVYGFKTTWFMVLKPCARPTFFIILLSKNITTSPTYCVFFLTHIFLRIIKFLLFYCFVRQKDYNISPILDCFRGRHLFWHIIRKFIFY